jgi:hypothetical protein
MKFDKYRTEDLVKLLGAGNYVEQACEAVGINKTTYYDWMKRGKDHDDAGKKSKYAEFYNAVKRAQAEAECRNVAIIQKAAQTQWQAAAWWLERTKPDRFGRQLKNEHSGSVEIKIGKEFDGV